MYRLKLTNWLLRNSEVHYRPYTSPPFDPILNKIYSISSITIHLLKSILVLSSDLRRGFPNSLFPLRLCVYFWIVPAHLSSCLDLRFLIMLRGKGWLGFFNLWSGQKPWWNWYLTPVVNFCEVQRAQLAKSILLASMLGPLGSVQMLKREWDAENNGKLPIYPRKTVTLVPEFAVEDLALSRTAALVHKFAVERPRGSWA